MLRHPQNSNLKLHYQNIYQGFPVQTARGPLVEDYLYRVKQVIETTLQQHGRVFAFRFDLRFPSNQHVPYADSNQVLERFIASFKAKIKHNRNKAIEANKNAHDTTVRYVWCREIGHHGVPHYHFVILLNNDAFCTLGRFEIGRENIFNRLHEGWASALGLPVENVNGLVEFPENHYYCLQREDTDTLAEFFFRVSYLCKAETKYYGNRVHGFGASRN
jgi:hypothetical protein